MKGAKIVALVKHEHGDAARDGKGGNGKNEGKDEESKKAFRLHDFEEGRLLLFPVFDLVGIAYLRPPVVLKCWGLLVILETDFQLANLLWASVNLAGKGEGKEHVLLIEFRLDGKDAHGANLPLLVGATHVNALSLGTGDENPDVLIVVLLVKAQPVGNPSPKNGRDQGQAVLEPVISAFQVFGDRRYSGKMGIHTFGGSNVLVVAVVEERLFFQGPAVSGDAIILKQLGIQGIGMKKPAFPLFDF